MPYEKRKKNRRKKKSATVGKRGQKWSARVTQTSDAMDLEKDVFKGDDPKKIARSVKHSSETSHRRKTSPYRSAVSTISFYENRAGKNLSASKRETLQNAKMELKDQFGRK